MRNDKNRKIYVMINMHLNRNHSEISNIRKLVGSTWRGNLKGFTNRLLTKISINIHK